MKTFIVTYHLDKPSNKIYTAISREEALKKFVTEVLLENAYFIEYLYDFSTDGFSEPFMWLVPSNQHNGIGQIKVLKKSIDSYFARHNMFAEQFFVFFMKWYPVEKNDTTDAGKERRNMISEEMRSYRFPKEMEQFIAMKESFSWCKTRVSHYYAPEIAPIR